MKQSLNSSTRRAVRRRNNSQGRRGNR